MTMFDELFTVVDEPKIEEEFIDSDDAMNEILGE
jgi:hypothetical protein